MEANLFVNLFININCMYLKLNKMSNNEVMSDFIQKYLGAI